MFFSVEENIKYQVALVDATIYPTILTMVQSKFDYQCFDDYCNSTIV
jgi:hypothetical protein